MVDLSGCAYHLEKPLQMISIHMGLHPTFRKCSSLLIAACCLILLVGCASAPAPATQPAEQNASLVTVRQLIDNSEEFTGQKVSLTGKIIIECTQGCWFFLDDGTGKIYVSLKEAGLDIPQKVGSQVILVGEISGSGGNLKILGEQVKFPE